MTIAMWKKSFLQTAYAALLLPASLAFAAEEHDHPHDHGDDPVLSRVIVDQLEIRDADGENPLALDAQAWIGKDLNKLWFKTDIERRDGETEEAEIQALYSRAISPFWNVQMGVRQDAKPTPSRGWGVLGVQGLAPYWFEVEAGLFVGESGRVAARFSAEYELLLTQQLILVPSIEVNMYGQNDTETATGSGLADANAGLRLRYEIRREFAPYIGINWSRTFGNTADFVESNGEAVSDAELVVGLRAWF